MKRLSLRPAVNVSRRLSRSWPKSAEVAFAVAEMIWQFTWRKNCIRVEKWVKIQKIGVFYGIKNEKRLSNISQRRIKTSRHTGVRRSAHRKGTYTHDYLICIAAAAVPKEWKIQCPGRRIDFSPLHKSPSMRAVPAIARARWSLSAKVGRKRYTQAKQISALGGLTSVSILFNWTPHFLCL